MTGFGPEHISVVREALISLNERIESLHGEITRPPVAGSPYANEIAVSQRQQSLDKATTKSLMLIDSGREHLMAFVRTITAPMLPIACWTCVRSMLEPCARAAWMLDPTINAETRLRRTFAVRFAGDSEDLKFGRAMSVPEQVIDEVKANIARLEREASALGVRRLRDRRTNKKIVGIGVRMPTATEMVKEVLDEEGAYRIFSAVSHGQAEMIRALSFTPVLGIGLTEQMGGSDAQAFNKTAHPDLMAWLGQVAAAALARPVWYEFQYGG